VFGLMLASRAGEDWKSKYLGARSALGMLGLEDGRSSDD
jgi:hypothetical protein